MQDLYDSMTPAEKQQYQREVKKQLNEVGRQAGNAIKEDVKKNGIVGTILKGLGYIAFSILTGGK